MRWKSRNQMLLGFIACLLLALGLAVRMAASAKIRTVLIQKFEQECKRCRLDIGGIHLSVLRGRVIGDNIQVDGDPRDRTRFHIEAKKVRVTVKLWTLFTHAPEIQTLWVDGLRLVLEENGDAPSGPLPDYAWLGKLPRLRADNIQAQASQFTYILKKQGKSARLAFHSIAATAGKVGTRRELSPNEFAVQASGKTLSGGEVRISGKIGLYENEKLDQLRVDVRNVQLSDLDSYFEPAEGVRLGGVLTHGTASLDIRKRRLTGQVKIGYQDLEIHFVSSDSLPSKVSSFVKGAVAATQVKKNEKGSPEPHPTAPLAAVQGPDQSVFDWVLDSLKEAAKKIITVG